MHEGGGGTASRGGRLTVRTLESCGRCPSPLLQDANIHGAGIVVLKPPENIPTNAINIYEGRGTMVRSDCSTFHGTKPGGLPAEFLL